MKKLLFLLCFMPVLCIAKTPKLILTVDDLVTYNNGNETEKVLALYYTMGVITSFVDETQYAEKTQMFGEEKQSKLAYCMLIEPIGKTLQRVVLHNLDGDIKGDESASHAIKTSLLEYCSKLVDRGDFDKEWKEFNKKK